MPDSYSLRYIVAEITKAWCNGQPVDPTRPMINQQFENVIEVNRQRGYKLLTFNLAQCCWEAILTETIIAVFERETEPPAGGSQLK